MTTSTPKTLSSRALQITALFLVASVAFGGKPGETNSHKQVEPRDNAAVTAPRDVPLIGTMVITAKPSRVILVTDLGAMTVTAARDTLVANLGSMTVTAPRADTLVANLGAMTVTVPRALLVASN